MPAKGSKKAIAGDAADPDGLVAWTRRHLEHLRVSGYSDRGLKSRHSALFLFVEWAYLRGISRPTEVSRPMLQAYQRHVFYLRKGSGKPLSFAAQRARVQPLVVLFRWLTRENVILANPASELALPKLGRRLPRAILTEAEVERVMATPDLTDGLGLRDRAMMEVLYATGVRRFELTGLLLADLDVDRQVVVVREGKGRRDRTVPISERALHWVGRYLDEARADYVVEPDVGFVFLDAEGTRLPDARVTQRMRRYILDAGIGKPGAVHIFRHTMATLMLEGGADVRVIQQILGHAELSTTEIYTRVSIRHAQAVYRATHPGATLRGSRERLRRSDGDGVSEVELLDVLEAEADEEA
jgi:integrase/recombinase XerD